jgi:hypothetical protein
MATYRAPAATFGLSFPFGATAASIRIVSVALVGLGIAVMGFMLALSLPHSKVAPPASFLGPAATEPTTVPHP